MWSALGQPAWRGRRRRGTGVRWRTKISVISGGDPLGVGTRHDPHASSPTAGGGGPGDGGKGGPREHCAKPGMLCWQVVGQRKRGRAEGHGAVGEHLTTLVSTPACKV
jgi:hypothetical protein